MAEQTVDNLLWDVSLLSLAREHYKPFLTKRRRAELNLAVKSFAEVYGSEAKVKASLYGLLALWKWAHSDYRMSKEQELSDRIKFFSLGPKLAHEKRLRKTNYTQNSANLFIDLILWNHVRVHDEHKVTFDMIKPLAGFFCQFQIFYQKPLDLDDPDMDIEDIEDRAYQAVRQRIRRLRAKHTLSIMDEAANKVATAMYATFR